MGLYVRVIDFAGMRMLRITDFTEQIIVCLFFLKVFPGDGLASEFPVFGLSSYKIPCVACKDTIH